MSSFSPRVMIMIPAAGLTGPAKGVFQLLVAFKREKIPFFLYNFKVNGNAQPQFTAAARSRDIDVFYLEQRGKSYLSLIRQAGEEVVQKKIDIVQTHGFKPSLIAFVLKYVHGVKWICFMHGTTTENVKVRFYHLLENCLQLFADRVIVVAESQRQKIFRGMCKKRVMVLHNAVDSEQPVRISAQKEQKEAPTVDENRTENVTSLVAVGRFSPEKGFDLLVDAFALVVDKRPDLQLILVGDGQERENLQQQVQRLNLVDRVHFAGYSETPGDYLLNADIVILPSRSEGIPNVALEAMALGKPVIATRVGGTPEVIRHGRDGVLIPPQDPSALASAIDELLDNPRLAAQLAAAGQRRVRAEFSPEKRVSRMLALYRELISGEAALHPGPDA